MKYCDLHCDALTAQGTQQVTKARLKTGGCLLQCFAAFVKEGGFLTFSRLADGFDDLVAREGYNRVRAPADLREDAVNALLTSEGGAFSTIGELHALYDRGVRMAGFVWNTPTGAGFPNVCAGKGRSAREKKRGLTPFGREALSEMARLGMIADAAHGSDALFDEVAAFGRPFAVSHTGAASVFDVARNLTDEQIARLSDCGGVAGLYACAAFLSEDGSAAGQREALLAHAKAIVRAGGEDVLAIGTDFDGIPENAYCKDPSRVPAFLQLLADELGPRIAEKVARDNFLRLFSDVCGA